MASSSASASTESTSTTSQQGLGINPGASSTSSDESVSARSPSSSTPLFTSSSTTTSSSGPTSLDGAGAAQSSSCGGAVPKQIACALSAGGIAGVSIACAVLGAAIALLIGALLLRGRHLRSRSNSRINRGHTHRLRHRSLRTEKPNKTLALGISVSAASQPLHNIETIIPQQADDETVKQKILILFDQIEIHVNNYYGEYDEKPSASQESEISRYETPCLAVPLAGLLEMSHRKQTLIKHCLGFLIVKLISSRVRQESLLPNDALAVMAIPEEPNPRSFSDQDYSLAQSRWRMLTVYLRPDLFDGSLLQEPGYDSHIEEVAARFSRAFDIFGDSEYFDQRVRHLKEVFRTAAKLALWLQSQPSTFNFDWGIGGSRNTPLSVVSVPAIMKIRDENGVVLNPPLSIQSSLKEGI